MRLGSESLCPRVSRFPFRWTRVTWALGTRLSSYQSVADRKKLCMLCRPIRSGYISIGVATKPQDFVLACTFCKVHVCKIQLVENCNRVSSKMFLYILSWFSMIFHVIFLTLALAAALFYLAELVEEYTVVTAKVITGTLVVTTVVYVGLLVLEGFPVSIIIAGIITNGLYFLLLNDFPFIQLTSPVFIGSVGMVFVNHYLAFDYFSSVWYPFSEILAYFTICLWIMPFAFFVSLSASENVLPTASSAVEDTKEPNYAYPGQRSSRRHGILALFSFLSRKTEGYLPTRTKTY